MRFGRLFACIALFACPAAPAFAAAGWGEFKSEHFILDTDGTGEQAATIMAKLEKLRAGDLQALVGEQLDLPGHIRVITPSSRGVFLEIAGNWTAAFYTHGAYQDPIILAPVDEFINEPEVVAHELAHAVSYYLFTEQPHWYAEGLAEFLQTLASRAGEEQVLNHVKRSSATGMAAGAVPANYRWFTAEAGLIAPGAKLLNWNGQEDSSAPGRYHASSWMLYHYLWNIRGKQFSAFQKQLTDGEDWRKAWLTNFPDLDPANPEEMATLDRELFNYRKQGRFVMYKIDAKAEVKTSSQPLSPADVRLWLLRLRQQRSSNKQEETAFWRAQLEKARAEDPKNPEVLVLLASLDGAVKPETARAAAEGAPQDFRGWVKLSEVATDPAERETAARKSVALNPECARCNNQLAWVLVQSGRAKEALTYANRALDLAPWDANDVDTLAVVALQLGQCPQALALQTRATRMEIANGQSKEKFEARLKAVQDRCAKK
jgi:tetratricopeptide (TPR) repeat protein